MTKINVLHMSSATINFTYVHCSRKELEAHEVSFNEDTFRKELMKAFHPDLQIQTATIEIIASPAQANAQYTVRISIDSPAVNLFHEECGHDPAKVLRAAIHNTVRRLHEEKNKSVDKLRSPLKKS